MHLLAKFGDPSFNPSKFITRTSPFFCRFWPEMTLKVVKIPLYIIQSEIYPRCTYWPNLVTLASILQKLSRGQTRFLLICAVLALFLAPNDLEGQGQIPPYTIPTETYLLCTYWSNLVNLDSIFQKLLCGQPRFFRFWLFWPQMTLKVKVKSLHKQSQPRTSQYTPVNQIWWF